MNRRLTTDHNKHVVSRCTFKRVNEIKAEGVARLRRQYPLRNSSWTLYLALTNTRWSCAEPARKQKPRCRQQYFRWTKKCGKRAPTQCRSTHLCHQHQHCFQSPPLTFLLTFTQWGKRRLATQLVLLIYDYLEKYHWSKCVYKYT